MKKVMMDLRKGRKPDAYEEYSDYATLRARRILEIKARPGTGPKWEPPGTGYPMHALITIQCEMCTRKKMIRPHYYSHWIRRDDGTIAYLCGACDYSYGTKVSKCMHER